MFVMTAWLALGAGGLAICGWLDVINPYVLLTAIFLIGVGFAFYSPAWTSVQPEIVSNDELPSAATLGGLQLNISGIIGPAIGGLLLRFFSPSAVFTMNSACFFLLLVPIHQLTRPKGISNLPLENFFESFITAIRYVSYTRGIQIVLGRNVLFAFRECQKRRSASTVLNPRRSEEASYRRESYLAIDNFKCQGGSHDRLWHFAAGSCDAPMSLY